MVLVEVVEEKPAPLSARVTTSAENSILDIIVSHFSQPIHIPPSQSVPTFLQDSKYSEDTSTSQPISAPVIYHCFETLCRDAISNSSGVAESFLRLYPSRIRPSVFHQVSERSRDNSIQSVGVAVLFHYDMLLSLILQRENRQGNGEGRPKLHRQRVDEILSDSLRHLIGDLTISVKLVTKQQEASSTEGENKTTITASRAHLQRYIIPCLLRLINKIHRVAKDNSDSIIDETTRRQCAAVLLGWGTTCLGPKQVSPALARAVLAEGILQAQQPSWPPYFPSSNCPESREFTLRQVDWQSLELNGSDWDDTQFTLCPTNEFWSLECERLPSPEKLQKHQQAYMRKLDVKEMITAVRQHFFGKDGLEKHESDESQSHELTRLHLGFTVVDKPVEYEKPYREIPSRMHAACVLISLLESQDLYSTIMEDLAPILYELLRAAQDRIQGMGAACLHHLFHISASIGLEPFRPCVWPSVLLNNLMTALELSVQTCRESSVLVVLGVAQAALLNSTEPQVTSASPERDSVIRYRRKVTQQWLMILHKNLHSADLVWGLLVGGVVRLLDSHARTDSDNDALELARLALSCFLPLIRQDEEAGVVPCPLTVQNQWLALVAMTHLFVAASPAIVHHEGKLLGSLLLCLGRYQQIDQQEQSSSDVIGWWAKHAAAMLVVTCWYHRYQIERGSERGEIVSEKLQSIIHSGAYQAGLVEVVHKIIQHAQHLWDNIRVDFEEKL